MTIDTINISTFGLRVQYLTGYTDLPALKRILSERTFDSNDIKFQEQSVKVKLFGQYASSAALETGINGLRTLIETDVEHDFVFSSRGVSFTGVVKTGFKTNIFKNDANIDMEIAIVV